MPIATILYITLAAIFALGFVFYAYLFRNINRERRTYFLGLMRFISILTLLVLLINPTIKNTEYTTVRPELVMAIDVSKSIENLEQRVSLQALAMRLKENETLKKKFEISVYNFGGDIELGDDDSLQVDRNKTDIYKAIAQLNKLYKDKPSALVLFSDGNSTYGQDYEFFKLNKNVILNSVVTGDTTTTFDLSINALNVNKYAFLNNQFPVEIFLNYSGKDAVKANFQLKEGNTTFLSKTLDFDKDNSSEIINATLTAKQLGTNIYEAIITSPQNEKNQINNKRRFAVEVIDERTNILLLSDISHPDIGALKKSIESNKQRKVFFKNIDKFNISELKDFQLVILYQPNNKFNSVFKELDRQKINRFIVTGTKTDWNYLNNTQQYFSKASSNQTQDLFPVYNQNFLQYQFEDVNFKDFPPLEDAFGTLNVTTKNFNTLLYQKIEGIATQQALLSIFEENNTKTGVLFGENLWKWRLENYRINENFELIDDFWNKFIQYLSSSKKRDRLTYESEPVYLENDEILITAQFFDQNYVVSTSVNLNISIKNLDSKEIYEAQMLPNANFYNVDLNALSRGKYEFIIKEAISGIQKKGRFEVLEYNVEQQFSSANYGKMEYLAKNNSGETYLMGQEVKLIKDLTEDKRFVSVQKSREKAVPLIDWKYLLILLVLSLSAEWFTRKYFGLI
ncbi:VWA domain-containing protein [Gillisia sp. CAL575]|uniref:VWA domain-containing protein n=1 Tax=Gillisia sp. CAL575 TaxID=985255 RepID=UPI0003A3EE3D|nr:VWA domain-containing protein [Gillisia sp. CAL575]